MLSQPANRERFNAEVAARRHNLVTLLEEYPSVDLPLAVLLDIVEKVQPAYYSISSSPKLHPTSIHLTVRVHMEKLKDGSVFHGVCWCPL